MKTEVKIGLMLPQAKELLKPPETGRGGGSVFPGASERAWPITLILSF